MISGGAFAQAALLACTGLACYPVFVAGGAACADERAEPVAAGTGESAAAAPLPLDTQVIALLQKTAKALESGSIEPAEEADFRALVAAAAQLKTDRTLLATERVRLEALTRIRLRHAAEAINRQAVREAKSKATPRLPDAPPVATLAQVPGNQGLGGGAGFGQGFAGGIGAPQAGGAQQEAEKLIDLIQAVISPETWDVNGGQGVIRYWSLGHGLVIRNSASEHERVGEMLQQLR